MTDALRETLDVFDDAGRGAPLTTSEVTDAVDVGRRSTYDRLDRLVERGFLETKEVGARGRVWWRPPTATVTTTSERSVEDRSEELLRAVFEHSNDAIFVLDPYADEILDVNDASCELLGYPREELLELGPSDCHPDEQNGSVRSSTASSTVGPGGRTN
ncbi:PAS domain S-box protein [Halospeciosus flavus]